MVMSVTLDVSLSKLQNLLFFLQEAITPKTHVALVSSLCLPGLLRFFCLDLDSRAAAEPVSGVAHGSHSQYSKIPL